MSRRRRGASVAISLVVMAATLWTTGCGDEAQGPDQSAQKELRSFAFLPARNPGLTTGVTATIDGTTVTATVPFGSSISALVATFSATGPSVRVGETAQTSGATPNDFTRPVLYRVVAADGSTRDYTVTVTAVANPAKDLTALSFRSATNPGLTSDATATIDGTAVTATVPFGTPVSALVATFSATGASVTIGGVVQTSEATPNDFTRPVVYRVVAADDSTKDYTVTVTVAERSARELTALSFLSATNPGLVADVAATINGSAVTVTVPFGTPVTALVATFETTGISVTVGGATQTSGTTPNDFTRPVRYRVVAADSATQDYTVTVTAPPQQAYVKASNTESEDFFGVSVALSADGSTLAVGAEQEDSAATGIGGDQVNESASNAGAVYVFTRTGATWVQQAYLKASNTGANDLFGASVALSADGSTLAVGAHAEDSAATGIGGNPADNSAASAGATYVFTRSGTTWTQQAYLKASNTGAGDLFGTGVALSGDGATLAVAAIFEDSAATGVGGNQADNAASSAGAVYVFTRSGTTWSQEAYVKASNPGAQDTFGDSLALSADGSTLAVGAAQEASAATGIGGNQADNTAPQAGAVYVLTRSGTTWTQQAYVKASNTDASDFFGVSVALSDDGSTLAVGALGESSAATGIGGNQADDSVPGAGAAYVFTRSGTRWTQQAYVKASNAGASDFSGGDDQFGGSVALSGDGSTLAVGAAQEDSAATGLGGDQADDAAPQAGAAYVFARGGTMWSQQAYVKASNTTAFCEFGRTVELSGDGSTLAVGDFLESSAATGVGGDEADTSAFRAGAVYVFR